MASQHKHAPWRKSILIPFWTLQLILELLMIGLLGISIGILVSWQNNNAEFYGHTKVDSAVAYGAADISVPIWMTMLVVCLILTITEIVLLARHKLKPLAFLVMNVVKSAIWTVIFIFDILSAVSSSSRTASALLIVIEGGLYLCFIIPLIYGSIIYHRFRRNAKSYKPVDPLTNPTEYPSQLPNATEYPGQYNVYGHSNDEESVPYAPSPIPEVGRTLSFEQRDTRFEPYRTEEHRRSLSDAERPMSVPRVNVEHHDEEVYEMESSTRALS